MALQGSMAAAERAGQDALVLRSLEDELSVLSFETLAAVELGQQCSLTLEPHLSALLFQRPEGCATCNAIELECECMQGLECTCSCYMPAGEELLASSPVPPETYARLRT